VDAAVSAGVLKEGSNVREARIDESKQGRLPAGEGWFVLNLGEMPWETVPGFGVWRDLDWARVSGDKPVVGIHIHVLQPGETNGYYHAEAAQEGFIVLSGECLALVEGQERPMRQWDSFIHRREPLTPRSEPATDRA
jgi:hypothetical protein